MKNNKLKYVLGLASIALICGYGIYYSKDVSAAKSTRETEVYIEKDIKNNVKEPSIEVTKEALENIDDIEKETDEFGNEIITSGDEYDYPIKKEVNTDTVVLNQDLLNELLSYENYTPYNVKVREDTEDDYDVQISVDLSNMIKGKKANDILERYNRYVKARYLIDTEAGWENVLIPFKLSYKNALDDTDSKIEPNIQIYEAYQYGVGYKDLDYFPPVTTLYILKSREERIGYIATKLPISKVDKCTLEIKDLNRVDERGIMLKFKNE